MLRKELLSDGPGQRGKVEALPPVVLEDELDCAAAHPAFVVVQQNRVVNCREADT